MINFFIIMWERGLRIVQLAVFFPFIFISWRLITLQYCSGFCHTGFYLTTYLTVLHPSHQTNVY